MNSVTTTAFKRTIIALAREREPDARWLRVEFMYSPTVTTALLVKADSKGVVSNLHAAAGIDHEDAVVNLLANLIAVA